MAMNKDILANSITNTILGITIPGSGSTTIGSLLSTDVKNKILDNWKLIANEIISHINTYALLTLTTHTHSGVTTGAGVSGPPVPGSNTETGAIS